MKCIHQIKCGVMLISLTASLVSLPSFATPAPSPGSLAMHPEWPGAKSISDVDTVDHLIASLYDVISGPAGKPRDWDRFRSLFLPDGRLAVVRPESPATKDTPAVLGDLSFRTPDTYIERNDPYFATHGFFERSVANRVEVFGNLVQVWSTYETRNAETDINPSARGINAIQIVHAHGRFWIASLIWEDERPGLALPDKYLN